MKVFVSYAHKAGFGCCDLTLSSNQISNMVQILAIVDAIKEKTKLEGIVIINIQPLPIK